MKEVEVKEGNVTVLVRTPTKKNKDDAQLVFISAWRKAVDNNAVLREKLSDYLTTQGLWDDRKQKKYEEIMKEIGDKSLQLNKGNIPFKKAVEIAFKVKELREEFKNLITIQTSYDQYTAEGLADNARFDYFVTVCVLDPTTKLPVFKDLEDYNERGAEPWAVKAATQLGAMLYGLDPDYEENLPENKFLKKYKVVDSDGRLVNKQGHLIRVDSNGVERLIDKDGNLIAYDESGNAYEINEDGTPKEKIEQLPFLDDEGNPIEVPSDEKFAETPE